MPTVSAAHGNQPPGPVLGQQHQRRHDLQAVDRQRERMRMPPRLPVDLGELPHMAVAASPGQARQGSHSRDGCPADPLVSRARLPDSFAADSRPAHLTPLTWHDS